jgi:hypothetical protein
MNRYIFYTCLALLFLSACAKRRTSSELFVIEKSPPVTIPADVTAQAIEYGVRLQWTPVENASSYNIYFATETGVSEKSYVIQRFPGAGYTHNYLDSRNTYYYRISSIGASGESDLSQEVSAKPIVPIISPPSVQYKISDVFLSRNAQSLIFVNDLCSFGPSCIYVAYRLEGTWQSPTFLSAEEHKNIKPVSNEDGSVFAYAIDKSIIRFHVKDFSWHRSVIPLNKVTDITIRGEDIFALSEGSLVKIDTQGEVENLGKASAFHIHDDQTFVLRNKTIHVKKTTGGEDFVSTGLEVDQFMIHKGLIVSFSQGVLKHHRWNEEDSLWQEDPIDFECCSKAPVFLRYGSGLIKDESKVFKLDEKYIEMPWFYSAFSIADGLLSVAYFDEKQIYVREDSPEVKIIKIIDL